MSSEQEAKDVEMSDAPPVVPPPVAVGAFDALLRRREILAAASYATGVCRWLPWLAVLVRARVCVCSRPTWRTDS
jgi:hypothetical protein